MGSFECACNRGYESNLTGAVAPGVSCKDLDECSQETQLDNCFRLSHCHNTVGSFTCECPLGFSTTEGAVDGVECTSLSSVTLEYAWASGNKIGLFFSWDIKTTPHSKDLISIEVQPIRLLECDTITRHMAPDDCPGAGAFIGTSNFRDAGEPRRTIFWMFAGAQGCGSQLTVAVGEEHVMDCHVDSNPPIPWSGKVIQQKSAGDGHYFARLFSYSLGEVVAVDSKRWTAENVEGLESPVDGEYTMIGGLTECVAGPGNNASEWSIGASCHVEVPRYAGPPPIPEEGPPPIRCGDGKLTFVNESCDDANNRNGDGCDEFCRIEVDTVCFYTYTDNVTSWVEEDADAPGQYLNRFLWLPGESTCVRKLCGDTMLNLEWEECDDGNVANLDGCSSGCKVERGYACEHSSKTNYEVNPPVQEESEICAPFVVQLNENDTRHDCPPCHPLGECALFRHEKVCRCQTGYAQLSRGGEQDNPTLNADAIALALQHCEDVDECKYRPVCSEDSTCLNTLGSFECVCRAGSSGFYDPEWGLFQGCVDDDECRQVLGSGDPAPYPFPCAAVGGRCTNTLLAYECGCAQGFNGTGYAEGEGCIDLDECEMGVHDCGQTQTCVNWPGSYWCKCNRDGFQRSGRECFIGGFYEDNQAGFTLLGRSGKPTWTQGLARQWQLPMLHATADMSTGVIQFLVNHRLPQGTRWESFSISPPESDPTSQTAYVHTAVYNLNAQQVEKFGPWECSPEVCHDCIDQAGELFVQKDPQDGGGKRKVAVVKQPRGLLAFRAAASTSDAVWAWTFEPEDETQTFDSIWIRWKTLNLVTLGDAAGAAKHYDMIALCRQRTPADNLLFSKADTNNDATLNLGELRSDLIQAGKYENEIVLTQVFCV